MQDPVKVEKILVEGPEKSNPPSTDCAENFIGKVLKDTFLIESLVGSGGWATVYRGKHLALDKTVAIKVLHKHLTQQPEKIKRFHREAKSLTQIESRHVVKVFDYGIDPSPYMVMEFMQGETLASFMESQKEITVPQALTIFEQICDALTAVHDGKIVHRDLKPENLFIKEVDGQLQVKLVDFGIAKQTNYSKITGTGHFLGTVHYMSPEQCLGEKVDTRSDIYALGCLMFEVLTGHKAFGDNVPGADYVMRQIVDTPPSIFAVAPERSFPVELHELIAKCMAKDPNARFSSIRQVKEELQRINVERSVKGSKAVASGFPLVWPALVLMAPSLLAVINLWFVKSPQSLLASLVMMLTIGFANAYYSFCLGRMLSVTKVMSASDALVRALVCFATLFPVAPTIFVLVGSMLRASASYATAITYCVLFWLVACAGQYFAVARLDDIGRTDSLARKKQFSLPISYLLCALNVLPGIAVSIAFIGNLFDAPLSAATTTILVCALLSTVLLLMLRNDLIAALTYRQSSDSEAKRLAIMMILLWFIVSALIMMPLANGSLQTIDGGIVKQITKVSDSPGQR